MSDTPRYDAFIAKAPRIFLNDVGDRECEALELIRDLERALSKAADSEAALRKALTELVAHVEKFAEENGEANFCTGDAIAALSNALPDASNAPKPFHTEANALRLLAFRDAHAADDRDEAYNAIYWLVSDNAADPFHPWTEIEAFAPGYRPGDFIVPTGSVDIGDDNRFYRTAELGKQPLSDAFAQGRGWIPVGERMPEPGDVVLLWVAAERIGDTDGEPYHMDTSEVSMGECREGSDGLYLDDFAFGHGDTEGITHWMPLPDAPDLPAQSGCSPTASGGKS